MSQWRLYEQLVDQMIDRQWGEPVELHPMIPGGVTGDPAPDPARPVIKATACFVRPGAKVNPQQAAPKDQAPPRAEAAASKS